MSSTVPITTAAAKAATTTWLGCRKTARLEERPVLINRCNA
jgi:hypothetical protein